MTKLEIAERFAKALDHNQFDRAAAFIDVYCRYTFRDKRIEGRESIIDAYRTNAEKAAEALDEIQYFSELEDMDEDQVLIKYLDRIRKGAQWHDYRCAQKLTITDGKITFIE